MPRRDPRTGKFLRRGASEARAYEARAPKRTKARKAAPAPAPAPAPAKRAPRRAKKRKTTSTANRPYTRLRRPGTLPKNETRTLGRGPKGAVVVYERRRARRRRPRHLRAHAPSYLSFGGVVLITTGTLVGWEAADLIHRMIVTASTQAQVPNTMESAAAFNAIVVAAKPTWASVGAQAGLAAVSFGVGAAVPWPWLKMLLFGIGAGSFGHVGSQLLNFYVMEPLFTSNSRLYVAEDNANNVLKYRSTTSGTTPGTSGQPPRAVAGAPAPRALPQGQPVRIPQALASVSAGVPRPPVNAPVAATLAAPPPTAVKLSPAPAANGAPTDDLDLMLLQPRRAA